MSERAKVTIQEAAHSLWELFFANCCGMHPYVSSIATGGDTIHVFLVREPMHHERQIPSEWEGWPIETRVTGRMRLC